MNKKFVYSKCAIYESLNALSKVVSSSDNKVFWMSLSKQEKTILFTATDGKNFIEISPLDKGQIEDDIVLCLPFVEFLTFINNAKHDDILFVVNDSDVICGFRGEKGKYKFCRYEYTLPEIPKIQTKDEINLNSIDFLDALNKTSFSVHPSKNRAPITGVKLSVFKDKFEAYSTDTGRISKYSKNFEKNININNTNLFLPKQSIDILKTLPYGGEVVIKLNSNIFNVRSGNNFSFTGPQEANGDKFPDISLFFTDTVYCEMKINSVLIESKLSLADAITKSDERFGKKIILSIDNDFLVMKITGAKAAIDEAIQCEEVEVFSEKEYSVVLPLYRIIEAVKINENSELIMKFIAPPKAINSVDVFILIEDENWKHLILTIIGSENE
jgi:DNA polymerase III sliding clamp (beta) subunit (PCNA family)